MEKYELIERPKSLSTVLSYIKFQTHYVLERATLARYDCPNDATSIDSLTHPYLVKELCQEIETLLVHYNELKVYLEE